MSLEGRLRDLGMPEVCQLLGSSRKSGTLRVQAPLNARAAEVRFAHGVVTDAAQWHVEAPVNDEAWERPVPPVADARALETCMLDLLTWNDGDFRFHAEKSSGRSHSPVRMAVEPLLVEAAQRAEVWERVKDRVPHARAVPAFVDIEPQQLPSLRLVPQEWEVLTRVDGRRTLSELAAVLGRNLLDVVEIVHALIGARVLTLRDHEAVPRRRPTPPSQLAIPTPDRANADVAASEIAATDRVGTVPDAAPESRREAHATDVISVTAQVLHAASTLTFPDAQPLFASAAPDAALLCAHGDDAARRGDLAGALTLWSAALRAPVGTIDADRVREAVALAARLHAMLQDGAGACQS